MPSHAHAARLRPARPSTSSVLEQLTSIDEFTPRQAELAVGQCSGFGPNTPTPNSPAMSRIACIARMLLPAAFSRGENAAIAKRPGTTATIPPPTPVLAGRPAVYIHSPDS